MTGPEHYREAEKLIGYAENFRIEANGDRRDGAGPTDRQADAFAEARRHISAAKVALNLAAH